MTSYTLATDILMTAGLDRLLDAYGIAPGSDPLRDLATGRYPAKNDPSKRAALAGMQKATLIGGEDVPLRLYAGIFAKPGLDAGFQVEPACPLVYKGKMTKGFGELLAGLVDLRRPLVIYTQGPAYERSLSRVAVTLDSENIRIGGEIQMAVDLERVATIMKAMKTFTSVRVFHLKLMRNQCENAGLLGYDPPWMTEKGRMKMRKMLGYKGRIDKSLRDSIEAQIDDAFDVLMDLPSPIDTSWNIAGVIRDAQLDEIKQNLKEKGDSA